MTNTQQANRVLCYSPYNFWQVHAKWELTILQAIRLRGAEVKLVHCDGQYTDCDVFWESTNPRNPLTCTRCQATVAATSSGMAMPFEWLGRYVQLTERRTAQQWAAGLAASEFRTARFEDWEVGNWVESSVHSHYRVSVLNYSDPLIEKTFRSYLYSGLVACFALDRLLADFDPEVLFLFNGRMSSTRVALELARRKGIRVVCHERGWVNESLRLIENAHCLDLGHLEAACATWNPVPLDATELREAHEFLKSREHGKNLSWWQFSPSPQDHADLRRRLGLEAGRKLWTLFTSSDDEVASATDWKSPFSGQLAWVQETLDFVRRTPDLDLVIRVHPNTAGKGGIAANSTQLREFEDLKRGLPSNVRQVMPDDDVSTYTLMEMSDVGLTYVSTAGIEMACKGKYVISAAGGFSRHASCIQVVRTAEDYPEMLHDALKHSGVDIEIRRKAYRFIHTLFIKQNFPLPLVRMPDPYTAELTYSDLSALNPGLTPELDRIVGVVMDGQPILPDPPEDDRLRDTSEEDSFFRALAEIEKARKSRAGGTLFTLILATSSDPADLERRLDALVSTTPDDLFDVVLVKNSMNPGVTGLLGCLEGDLAVVDAPEGVDETEAWRIGEALANGRYVVRLPREFVPYPGWLEQLAGYLPDGPGRLATVLVSPNPRCDQG